MASKKAPVPVVPKISPKQQIEELKATVSFLSNVRTNLTQAGSILKGENDKHKVAISILERRLENLQKMFDKSDNELYQTNNYNESLKEKVSDLQLTLEKEDQSRRNLWQVYCTKSEELAKAEAKLGWAHLALILILVPYVFYGGKWLFNHVFIGLH